MGGFADFSVFFAYSLVFLSTVVCIIYGIANWNKEGDVSEEENEEEKKWLKTEIEIDEEVAGGGAV